MTTYDFHVSKNSRVKYQFEDSLFSLIGNLIISNFPLAREVSEKINAVRRSEGDVDYLVTPGNINALGLLHELFHLVIRKYEEDQNPGVFSKALNFLSDGLSEDEVNSTLLKFIEEFPPVTVFKNDVTAEEYLEGQTSGKPNREIIIEEIILLHLENINPATNRLSEFYSDKILADSTSYKKVIEQTEVFFDSEKPVGSDNLSLFNFLKRPIITNPFDIEQQLIFIKEKWGLYIPENLIDIILKSSDLIKEDYKIFVQHGGGEKATPPVPVYEFDSKYFEELKTKLESGQTLTSDEHLFYYSEIEKFTEDTQWMPQVVMLAKNTFVWLDQLSKKYHRNISTLDQVPDEELDDLAKWNFTCLWLIGIWERSSASKKIKQLTGNTDATSSAYSLFDYVIASELGGEDAFNNLKHRAMLRGIRMASDMVPNHTGIYSKWVVEKPDYFIQRDDKPYPSYSFTGPNLSEDERVQVRIEDKYYSRADAAVVFQRVDSYTGSAKYIYHGNDGTNMPWNDTAQLNLLNPEVRESLIQTIMHVARKTPIIRFDAAMTLAKKHYQRLWYPQPGSGGAIPSRSDFSMTRGSFDDFFPVEFWREVVDRINAEMPNTLLLAEAFWLMESYFVRTLGMHRVYNSAFMHMMMKEENEKYRLLVKNTLDFNPEILKRYVNFMSNPDEETAVNQFGKGDKYFGVSLMMITLPGLPMFGHGQVEGFSEKYGMEYKRAYYNEIPDQHLIWQHQQEIFPLLKKRYLFSQAGFFQLYDFIDSHGNINENVYAYTNRAGSEVALVLYNNSYNECKGTINFSVAKAYSESTEYQNGFVRVASALGFKSSSKFYYICREHKTNLQYLFSGREISDHGFHTNLRGYQYKIFLDFSEVYDADGKFEELYRRISNKGVESIDRLIKELENEPIHNALNNYINSDSFKELSDKTFSPSPTKKIKKSKSEDVSAIPVEFEKLVSEFSKETTLEEPGKLYNNFKNETGKVSTYLKAITKKDSDEKEFLTGSKNNQLFMILYCLLKQLMIKTISDSAYGRVLFEKILLNKFLESLFNSTGDDNEAVSSRIQLIKVFLDPRFISSLEKLNGDQSNIVKSKKLKPISTKKSTNQQPLVTFISDLFSNDVIFNLLLVNEYDGIRYFNKERFESFVQWLTILTGIFSVQKKSDKKIVKPATTASKKKSKSTLSGTSKTTKPPKADFTVLKPISINAGYDVDKFLELLKDYKKIETKKHKQKQTRGKLGKDKK
ncbi:MAG: alpha-amylase [Ignavibacteriales bacterium]|nr:MAG: alpha-amylase [Ignavibacteriales bacterium]